MRALSVFIVLVATTFCIGLRAEDAQESGRISVTGSGQVDLAPDMAILDFAVVSEADTAEEALEQNSVAMRRVMRSLRDEKIAKRDLQTSGFNIQPRYDNRNHSGGQRGEPRIVGYSVRNALTVRVRDLDRLGAIVDRSVKLGINQGGNIRFTNNDPSDAVEEAREMAVKDAKTRAATLARAAGVKLGRLLELSEHSMPQPMGRMMRSEVAMAASAVPVASGENTYTVMVNARFEIDE